MAETNHETPINAAVAAALTGLARSTLAKLRCLGGGPPFIKAGRKVLYRPIDLTNWLDQRRVTNTSEALLLPPRLTNACSKATERRASK
jgi:hypothetical protein